MAVTVTNTTQPINPLRNVTTMGITNGNSLGSHSLQGNVSITGGTLANATLNTYRSKVTYKVLGSDIEVDGYRDYNVGLSLAMLNSVGISFYKELKAQEIQFPKEIEEFLQKEMISYERNKKIDNIL